VRNGGKYDGRLGIFVPMVCVRELSAPASAAVRPRVVAFAEEEGQRYKATFLGSGALSGQFDPLARPARRRRRDDARCDAPRRPAATQAAIVGCKREPGDYLGFVEVHIEQGPVLNELGLPLGVVTSINGGVRFAARCAAWRATPARRRWTAARRRAAGRRARRCTSRSAPRGAEPGRHDGHARGAQRLDQRRSGRCKFSLDIRATTDAVRDACVDDVLAELARICERRGCRPSSRRRCAPRPRRRAGVAARWERAVGRLGCRSPHAERRRPRRDEAAEVMPQAMLFVRGENAGISHNPLESTPPTTSQLAIEAFARSRRLLESSRMPTRPPPGAT
jgi:N-carbamoyl-L-amino-acid hydrolase